ncbi:MAG: hypothetical protein LUF04_14875 [Bacteroides sp.]|nr:hypothetical protein [Bacteroides sp.]
MLKRLIVVNSEIYSIADIQLDSCDSIQVTGPNNIGKSTLIYALNFLYIIDGKLMIFSGGRTGDKITLNHYFPSVSGSYIIFEILKQRYYSILVRKDAEGKLEYYKIDSDYKESLYFIKAPEGRKIKRFEKLLSDLTVNGITYSKFSSRRELFNFVYQRGRKNNGVVWLNQNVSHDAREISNNFSRIYRYLIHAASLDNHTLKESLIVADSKDEERVEFSKKHQQDVNTLRRYNEQTRVTKSIIPKFDAFKELVERYKALQHLLSELVYAFDLKYKEVYPPLLLQIKETEDQRNSNETHIREVLLPRLSKLNQSLGANQTERTQKKKQIEELTTWIKNIKAYEGLPFLEQARDNLDVQRKHIEGRLYQIDDQSLSSKELESSILACAKSNEKLVRQIESYSNQLIHRITPRQEDKELLHAILSDEVSALSCETIRKEVTRAGRQLKLFDGEIDLPGTLIPRPIPSIEELKEQLVKGEKDKKHYESLLPVAKDKEKYERELKQLSGQIKEIEEKINSILLLPEKEEKLQTATKELAEVELRLDSIGKEIEEVNRENVQKQEEIKALDLQLLEKRKRTSDIRKWKEEVEFSGIDPVSAAKDMPLDALYADFNRLGSERDKLKINKEREFDSLKEKTRQVHSCEEEFIRYMDSEIATLEEKEKSIKMLLTNISAQFAIPCKTLLNKFEEFGEFITKQFNPKIRKIKISDIESLEIEISPNQKLLDDLEKIMGIQDLTSSLFFDDQDKSLATLNNYLDGQITIYFRELFDIRVRLKSKGNYKTVDFRKQVESDGTDKMIRLAIVMSIINQLIVSDPENRVVIFVDEIEKIDVANRGELLNFCKENNFLPIFASPGNLLDGFGKYYTIRKGRGKLVVTERNGNLITRKTKAAL